MTGGYVTGGWGFVWAAYGLTAVVLLTYGVTLITRLRGRRSGDDGKPSAR
jgi:heme exporter protein D